MGLAGPLQAVTGNVSNLSLTPSRGHTLTYRYASAQRFTTGGNSAGYTLQQVTLNLKANYDYFNDPHHPEVYLYSRIQRGSNEKPHILLAILTAPTEPLRSDDRANYVYTCKTGCALNTNTHYFIVVIPQIGYNITWGDNTSGSETNTPTNGGWSIANTALHRNAYGSWLEESPTVVKLMKVSWATEPGKVAGVTVTARNASLDVGWTPETGSTVTSYKVQWKSGAQNWDAANRQVVTTKNRTTLTGLTNNTQYTIRVAATNTSGDGGWSDNTTGTPSANALTLTATPTPNGALFALSNHTGNFYYKVTPPSNANCDDGSAITGNPRTFTDYTKDSGTEHNITVYSDPTCSTVLTSLDFITLPAKTTGVTLKNTGASLGVSWTAVTGADSYKVQWKSSSDSGWDATNRQTTTTTSATIPSLTNNTAYTVRVAAGNASGDGEWSDEASATPSAATLTASNVTSTGATLTVTGHTGTVYLSGRGGGSYSLACTAVSGGTHSPTLPGNTTYEFKAYNNSGCTGTALASTSFTTPGAVTLGVALIDDHSAFLYLQGWRSLPNKAISHILHEAGSSQPVRRCGVATNPGAASYNLYEPLKAGTTYTAHYFRGASCAAIERFASVTFTTLQLSVGSVGATSATLQLNHHESDWSYQGGEASGQAAAQGAVCSNVSAGETGTVNGLTPGTQYTYTAYEGPGCYYSHELAQATFTTQFATAPEPVAVVTVAHQGSSLDVSWDAPARATHYHVTYTDNNGASWQLAALEYAGTSLTINGVDSTKTYLVGVRAKNTAGTSGWTNSAAATLAAPDPVASVTAVHQGSSLAVSWPAAARAASYHVTYTGDNGTSWQLAALEHTDTSLTINGVDSSKTYIVGVRAKNAAGGSDWTNSSAATLVAPPDPVASVTVVHTGSSLEVTWPAAARAASYHVTYTSDNGTSWQLAALERTDTSLTINGVDSSKTYIVGVRAKNAAGGSDWTNSSAATLVAPPDPVASVTVVHTGSSLEVTWPAAARAASYHVTYTSDNGTSWQLAALEHTGTSLTINGVDGSKTYMVGVRAKNAGGGSGWVNSAPAAPPALSVDDATAAEPGAGQSATLYFVVRLNREASGTVTVDYATSDGTATAGADYTAASGTLTFVAGQTLKTVLVTVLNDAHDEGSETMTLTLSNATGAVIDSNAAVATGTITNAGSIPQAWISRFGRTVADQVVEAVASRLRSEPTPGLEVTLAGERLGWSTDADAGQPVAQQAVEQLAQWLVVGNGESGDVALRTIQGRELVASSSFAFASPTASGSLFSFWGRGAVTNFDGREGELSLDGEVTTWLLGTDWSWGQWPGSEARRSTAGLLLSRSRANGGYDSPAGGPSGDVDATLTGVFPWGSHRFTDRLAAWGVAGYGQGELEVTPKLPDRDKDGAAITTDLNLWLAAAGLRGTLLDGGNNGLTITGKTDAMVVGNSSERVTGLEAAQATVTRLRLGIEAQRPIPLGNPDSGAEEGSGAVLTPSLEMGLRHDGGDAETGFGLDLGGGILLSHPQRGLEAEVRGRGLLTHAAEGFRNRGFSGSLSWQQRPDSDLGAALSLTQTMGGSSSGGADALLSRITLEGLAANNGDDDLKNQRLELQLSYGFPAFGDRFTLTPELGLGLYDSGRDYRIGWRLTHLVETGAFDLSFDVTRRESINNDGTAPDHGVQLEVNTRF